MIYTTGTVMDEIAEGLAHDRYQLLERKMQLIAQNEIDYANRIMQAIKLVDAVLLDMRDRHGVRPLADESVGWDDD